MKLVTIIFFFMFNNSNNDACDDNENKIVVIWLFNCSLDYYSINCIDYFETDSSF